MKKLISICMVLMLVLSLLPAGTVMAAEAGDTVTKLVNVAENKPVSSEHSRDGSYDPQVITDDNLTNANFWYGYVDAAVKPNITIDLQRRYPIEKIRVFDRGDATMPTRGQFEIWGADSEDFSDGRKLFELNDNAAFPEKYDYVIELSEKPICRYIRYQAKNAAVVYLREIQVFATVTATEISRRATTYTTNNLLGGASMGGAAAVDGSFTDGSSLYIGSRVDREATHGYYSAFTIDLGSSKAVDMIEMYNRVGGGGGGADYKGNFVLYGSNEGTITDFDELSSDGETILGKIDQDAFESLKQADSVTPVYTALAGISGSVANYTAKDGSVYSAFPSRTGNDDTATCFQATLDSSEAYRYLTYRKNKTATKDGNYHLVQLTEVRAYQIHPEIYDIAFADNKITVDCSEEMDYDTFVNAISLADASTGTAITGASTEIDPETPYRVIITLPELFDKTVKVTISNDAESTRGVALSKIYEKEIVLPSAVEVKESVFTDSNGTELQSLIGAAEIVAKAKLTNNSSENQKLLMLVCAYDASNSLKGVKALETSIARKTQDREASVALALSEALAAGDYVTIHLWDGLDAASSYCAMIKKTAQ